MKHCSSLWEYNNRARNETFLVFWYSYSNGEENNLVVILEYILINIKKENEDGCMPATQLLRKLRQDNYKFKVSLNNLTRLQLKFKK